MEYVGGMDYNSGPYSVQFNARVTRVPFNVMINNDNVLEDDETFNLNINTSSLPNGVTVGDPSLTTVTISANDGKCKLSTFGSESYYIMLLVIKAIKFMIRHRQCLQIS